MSISMFYFIFSIILTTPNNIRYIFYSSSHYLSFFINFID
nr:MAG TPA: hypothetical protein [Caudoviricetes sp.]